MADPAAEGTGELLSRMLQKQLYVVFSRPTSDPQDLRPALHDHLQYMIGLEKRGLLFASGPFLGEDGALTGDGMTIVRAETHAEAEGIAREDPFHVRGLRTYEIRRWQLNEGRLTFSVDASDRTGTFD